VRGLQCIGKELRGKGSVLSVHRAISAGLREREPLLAFFNAYFDESGKFRDKSVVSFSGWVAEPDEVDRFSRTWRRLLRETGLEVLKMSEALRIKRPLSKKVPALDVEKRIEALTPFAECIAKYAELIVLTGSDVNGFRTMAQVAQENLGNNPHYASFGVSILDIVQHIGADDFLSLFCDDDEETSDKVLTFYRKVRIHDRNAKKKLISITFADDKAYAPLQAADMIASLARREAAREFFQQDYLFRPLFSCFPRIAGVRAKRGFWGRDTWISYGQAFAETNRKAKKLLGADIPGWTNKE
jgi:hypothetical protein